MPREKSIKLSKKHGLQATMPLCPCCGKPKGTIAMLGAAGDKLAKALGRPDGEMPMEALIPGDVELCDECAKKGIQLIEAIPDNKGKMRVTGRFFIVKEEWLDCINDEKLKESIRKARKSYIDAATADQLQAVGNGE